MSGSGIGTASHTIHSSQGGADMSHVTQFSTCCHISLSTYFKKLTQQANICPVKTLVCIWLDQSKQNVYTKWVYFFNTYIYYLWNDRNKHKMRIRIICSGCRGHEIWMMMWMFIQCDYWRINVWSDSLVLSESSDFSHYPGVLRAGWWGSGKHCKHKIFKLTGTSSPANFDSGPGPGWALQIWMLWSSSIFAPRPLPAKESTSNNSVPVQLPISSNWSSQTANFKWR